MENKYYVINKFGLRNEYYALEDVAEDWNIINFDSFRDLAVKLKRGYNAILMKVGPKIVMVDEREQAIYKRLCGIKRPKPKVQFNDGEWIKCVVDDYFGYAFTKGNIYKVSYCDGKRINFYKIDEGVTATPHMGRFRYDEGAFAKFIG